MSNVNPTKDVSIGHIPNIIYDILDTSEYTESISCVKREISDKTCLFTMDDDRFTKNKPNHMEDYNISTHLTVSGI